MIVIVTKMKIKTERDCCAPEDMKLIEGSPTFNKDGIQYYFCIHCGLTRLQFSTSDNKNYYLKLISYWELLSEKNKLEEKVRNLSRQVMDYP